MKSHSGPLSLPIRSVEIATRKSTTLKLNIWSNKFCPCSLVFNANTYVYSDVQCADEKGKGKDASQLPEYAKLCSLSVFSR
jgi:hypothetical protein